MSTDHRDDDDRALAAAVARLPREITPHEVDRTWSAIEARLAPRRTRHFEAAGAVLAAAAAVLCLLTPPSTPPHDAPTAELSLASEPPDALLTTAWSSDLPSPSEPAPELADDEGPFLATLATLDADFRQARAQLPASDAARIDESLRAVDAAIETTRTALQTHPDDFDLRTDLLNAYRDKVTAETDVLDLTTRI